MQSFAFRLTACVVILSCLPLSARARPRWRFSRSTATPATTRTSKKGGLDLTALKVEPANPDNFARWVKVHDRIDSGEMPPKKKARPGAGETAAARKWLHDMLVKAEQAKAAGRARPACAA